MQTYCCTCGNRLFFENTQCLACQAEVGWCEGCGRLATLESGVNGDFRCTHADCRRVLRKCHNYAIENVCNHCFVSAEAAATATNDVPAPAVGAPDANAEQLSIGAGSASSALCRACQLTETIPDLSTPGHREKWARLEAAKRRLLYTLDRLGLPYADVEPRLTFDFKADVEPPGGCWRDAGPLEIVYTGHCDGKITINIREADDAEREKLRTAFHEAHRTLIGHFHHEVGHYYWQLLVQGNRRDEMAFRRAFGDHDNPPYAEAMAAYYQNGPRAEWAGSYISVYASAHPWEDFAETFGLYLDAASVLDTARHLFRSIKPNFQARSVAPLVERFQEVGILVNEFNRTMGLIDLVPEVVVAPVVEKLQFVHDLVRRTAGRRRRGAAKGRALQAAATPKFRQAPDALEANLLA